MAPVSTRLRVRLVLMALTIIVPALAVIGYDQIIERRRARDRAIEDTVRLARLAASQEAAVFDGVQQLLLTLSRFPGLRESQPTACNALLPTVLRDHPSCLNIWVTNADGLPFCAAIPVDPRTSSVNRTWFDRVMKTHTTVVGDYQIGATDSTPDVVVAHPIVGDSGHVDRIVAAAVGLDQLNAIISRAQLPRGATVTLADRHRTILAQYPDSASWVGKPQPLVVPTGRSLADWDSPIVEAADVDGARRLYAIVPIHAGLDSGLYLTMDIAPAAMFTEVDELLRRHVWLFGFLTLVALGVALVGGQVLVLRPVEVLKGVMHRIATGDFGVRVQFAGGVPGLSDLGAAVDAMASALEARQQERDKAEAERRLLAAIVEDSDDAIYATTLDGAIVSWNTGAEKLYGFAAAEAVGRHLSIIFPADRGPELTALLNRLRRGEHITRYETVRQRKDGSQVAVSLTRSPVRNATGQITGGSIIGRDISERQRAEETLRASEERFRRITETIAEVFWMADVSPRKMVYVSPAYERIWGRTCESLYQNPGSFFDAVHVEDRQRLLDMTAQLSGQPFDHEFRIVRSDGEVRWIWDRGFPVLDGGGLVVQYVGAAQDVTERLQAELALRDVEERMRFALEASHVGIWEGNLKTGQFYWSATHEAMHGLAPGTFGGSLDGFLERVHPDDRDEMRKTIAQAARARRDAEFEYRTIWPDGTEHWIRTTAHYSYDTAGALVRGAGVAVDVTARRLLENQFRQAQKMEAVGQFAGGIAHDFNNVLTAVLGNAEFVLGQLQPDDARREDVEEIVKAGRRGATLTQQLLAFSRKQILSPRVLRLGDVVTEVAPMLRRLLGETIELRTVVRDRGRAKADAGQMEQILVNLAVNARDAMEEGGSLTIETTDVSLDAAYARQHVTSRPGPYVMVAVSDTGRGMDPATQQRVFEPFFTTKPKGQGTGLGLATVYGIVKQSGGHIWVYSEVGHGTTFKIYLPRTEEEVEAVPESRPVDARTERGDETILLVEDDDVVREFAAKVLVRRGYTVHAFAEPTQAIAFVQAHQGAIHLILSDVVLPSMSGRAMATHMQETHAESEVLYMSGYTDDAIVHHGVLDPGIWFVQKPFSGDVLVNKVRDVLDARAH